MYSTSFDPGAPELSLHGLPPVPAVFALRGETGEPYLNRTTDLRRRLARLLTPAPAQSKRLQLAALVRHIEWTETASDFEAQLLLYRASKDAFDDRAARRMRLFAPFFLRIGMRNRFPRLWVTNTLSAYAADDLFGPFPSRHAAERYAEAALDLHLLRRCFQDLEPDPEFPGCIYSEMKKCLAPCYGGCSDERYANEAAAVHAFLRTRGLSLLDTLSTERDRASEALDFETAAATHARRAKVEAVAALAPEATGALSAQRAVLVQPSTGPDQVALYSLAAGLWTGPVLFSVLGMRLPNEGSGSSSLFAHPAALAPVPLGPAASSDAAGTPEDRLRAALAGVAPQQPRSAPDKQTLAEHQALFARWYFRPQAKRVGEIVWAEPGAVDLPLKPLLRACARVFRAYADDHAPPGVSAPGTRSR